MELLVAMMIIAVIATIGVKKYSEVFRQGPAFEGRRIPSRRCSEGLDQYYLQAREVP